MPNHTITSLLQALKKYDEAAEKFIEKVESGRAHSKETYADLKAALETSRLARINAEY